MAKPYWEKCRRGKLLKAVMAEALPDNVALLGRADERAARGQLIASAVAYCNARCGGCPLTRGEPTG
ncbi:hypothetical protein [Brevundimonas sp.]|uniref:hypothetical protein n=1 Tax=Brevundimonas sp. TaxID=1871086 RepID=UPI002D49FAFE|nr:hypothetical protein [Brevundimonas sp.]HYC66669.1 hypothetical protein [Brevundimonas sp.]